MAQACGRGWMTLKTIFRDLMFSRDSDEEWRKQAEAMENNQMYQLVHLGGQGFLIDEYIKRENDYKFGELLQREIPQFLYSAPDHYVSDIEFAKFQTRFLSEKERVRASAKSDAELLNDFYATQAIAFEKFEPHAVCWDLNKRGEAGETIIHLCFLNNTVIHKKVAYHLLALYPRLALDIYEGNVFHGESAVHLAIVNNDLDSVKLLVDTCKAELNRRATGNFFRPNDYKNKSTMILNVNSQYDGQAYFGEYPLAFAASLGHVEIYDYLIDASSRASPEQGRCDPNAVDSFGNSIIHMIVIHNQMLLLHHAVYHAKMPASITIENHAGLTPLELSYRLGRGELFASLLELSSETQWVFSNVMYVAYPLNNLDSIGANGEMNKHAALNTIVENSGIEHLEMLNGQVISKLLEKKWKYYAKSRLLFKFFWTLLHLFWISLAVFLRPRDVYDTAGFRNWVRILSEVCIIIGAIAKVISEVLEIISRGSLWNYGKSLIVSPTKALFMIAIFFLLACVPCRIFHWTTVEDYLLINAIPMSWIHLMYFFRGHPNLGPMIVAMGKMITGDFLRIIVIYTIFLSIFAEIFFFMFKGVTGDNSFESFNGAYMTLFHMTLGELHFDALIHSRFGAFAYIVFMIFIILIPIMLLNMLIAMMTRTYTNIGERAQMEWKRQWAMLVLNIERSIPKNILLKYQTKYSTLLELKVERRRKRDLDLSSSLQRKKSMKLETVDECEEILDGPALPQECSNNTEELNHEEPSLIGDVPQTRVVKALLIHKVLPKSQATTRREVKLKWKALGQKLISIAKARKARQERISQSRMSSRLKNLDGDVLDMGKTF